MPLRCVYTQVCREREKLPESIHACAIIQFSYKETARDIMWAPPFPASERGSALLLVSCCAPYREATDRDQTPFTASLSVRQESCCRRAECLHLVVEQFDRSTSIELLTTALFKFKTETESSSMLWLCCYKTRENQPQSKEEKFDFKMTTTTTTTNLFAVGLLLLAAYPGRH